VHGQRHQGVRLALNTRIKTSQQDVRGHAESQRFKHFGGRAKLYFCNCCDQVNFLDSCGYAQRLKLFFWRSVCQTSANFGCFICQAPVDLFCFFGHAQVDANSNRF